MKNKNRVMWVEKNKFYLGEDKILYETFVGDINDDIVNHFEEVMDKFLNMVDGKMNILVDLNEAGTATRGARVLGYKALQNDRIGKIAVFGLNPVARVTASFFIEFSDKKDLKFFKTKQEALEWLRN